MTGQVAPFHRTRRTAAFIPVGVIALLIFGSGLVHLLSVAGNGLPYRLHILTGIFPIGFIHLSRSVVLLLGFALVITSVNIYKRKRRAFQLALLMSAASVVFHLTTGLDYEEALVSFAVIVVLLLTRRQFTVKSSTPTLGWAVVRLGIGAAFAFTYGVAGFWFLERNEFGVNFHLHDAILETVLYLGFMGDPELTAQTRFAVWFEGSLYLISATAILYALIALFRPVVYQFRTHPRDRLNAKDIVEHHGSSALDFFKYWPDKSYFFSPSRKSFIAYRVGNNFALALADPVGPAEEIEGIIRSFSEFCADHDWKVGFHQALPDFLPIYERCGFHKLKLGDDAVVELDRFNLDGRGRKELRHTMNQIECQGIEFAVFEPPVPDGILESLSIVSDDWLGLPGRRERQFTLGSFDPDYLRTRTIFAATDEDGSICAFLNQMPSFCPGEATIDLMRHRNNAPRGIMDYLFVKILFYFKEKGFSRFNLGMAPMSGFQEHEEPSREERAIHYFFQNLNFLFSYRGLKHFKAKYATRWEPRYTLYRNVLDLPQYVMALGKVSEIRDF